MLVPMSRPIEIVAAIDALYFHLEVKLPFSCKPNQPVTEIPLLFPTRHLNNLWSIILSHSQIDSNFLLQHHEITSKFSCLSVVHGTSLAVMSGIGGYYESLELTQHFENHSLLDCLGRNDWLRKIEIIRWLRQHRQLLDQHTHDNRCNGHLLG